MCLLLDALGPEVDAPYALDRALERALDFPSNRLAAYGTLRPGESNFHLVSGLRGSWTRGFVAGRLHWKDGIPELLRSAGPSRVPVTMLQSRALPHAWKRLDTFEGPRYRRTLVAVFLSGGRHIAAWIYQGRGRASCEEPRA